MKENIKNLEELSNTLNDSINKLKNIFLKINEEKEQIKLKIQNIFTKIRNTLNDREDKLLLKVDEIFNDSYMKEEDINQIIKKGEKLPYEIKLSLEKGKNIEKQLNDEDNKLISLINDCLNIENNIKNMNRINENIKICGSEQLEIKFIPEKDEEINIFLDNIINFGKLIYNNNFYKFKQCPNNIEEGKIFVISGKNENILTKTGNDSWTGTICQNKLELNREYKWKIKILYTNI